MEEEDLTGSVWMPVIIENRNDLKTQKELIKDPNVKEMDLAAISEKEVFVRKADIVRFVRLLYQSYRMILRKALRIASQQST